jgi:hypothetical protein
MDYRSALPQVEFQELLKRQGSGNGNDGVFTTFVFDPIDQFVDVGPGSGHEFMAPSSTDKRGPCPGLNAAANHGFLPRNGIATADQAVQGLTEAYNFGTDTSLILALIAIGLTGDPLAGTWSIGGPYPSSIFGSIGCLLICPVGEAEGLSYSHVAYKGDASPTRMDAYLNKGDAYTLNLDRFEKLYFSATNYTLDDLCDHAKYTRDYSIANNPWFFSASFGGILGFATHFLIPTIMSNHAADQVNGWLDRATLKSFYGIPGPRRRSYLYLWSRRDCKH